MKLPTWGLVSKTCSFLGHHSENLYKIHHDCKHINTYFLLTGIHGHEFTLIYSTTTKKPNQIGTSLPHLYQGPGMPVLTVASGLAFPSAFHLTSVDSFKPGMLLCWVWSISSRRRRTLSLILCFWTHWNSATHTFPTKRREYFLHRSSTMDWARLTKQLDCRCITQSMVMVKGRHGRFPVSGASEPEDPRIYQSLVVRPWASPFPSLSISVVGGRMCVNAHSGRQRVKGECGFGVSRRSDSWLRDLLPLWFGASSHHSIFSLCKMRSLIQPISQGFSELKWEHPGNIPSIEQGAL